MRIERVADCEEVVVWRFAMVVVFIIVLFFGWIIRLFFSFLMQSSGVIGTKCGTNERKMKDGVNFFVFLREKGNII